MEFKNIDSRKAALLNNFAAMAKNKSSDDILPLMLAFNNKAKKENITFTSEETDYIIEMLVKDLPVNEKEKVNALLQLLRK